MKLAYFPDQAALNSKPVLAAFIQGCLKLGITLVENSMDADAAVIWSVLWQGRMKNNQKVYEHYRKQGKDVFVIDVGTLKRGVLWKISLNNINRLAAWGNEKNLDLGRSAMLGLSLKENRQIRPRFILLAAQHERSLQWAGQLPMHQWVDNKVLEIRQYTDMPIVVRPHPRFHFTLKIRENVRYEKPVHLPETYDDYNINYNYHCVINFCSSPGISAAINGTPVICDQASLAYPVSSPLASIEEISLPDRTEWFTQICHTEWTVEEIRMGIPIQRLLDK